MEATICPSPFLSMYRDTVVCVSLSTTPHRRNAVLWPMTYVTYELNAWKCSWGYEGCYLEVWGNAGPLSYPEFADNHLGEPLCIPVLPSASAACDWDCPPPPTPSESTSPCRLSWKRSTHQPKHNLGITLLHVQTYLKGLLSHESDSHVITQSAIGAEYAGVPERFPHIKTTPSLRALYRLCDMSHLTLNRLSLPTISPSFRHPLLLLDLSSTSQSFFKTGSFNRLIFVERSKESDMAACRQTLSFKSVFSEDLRR